MELKISIKAMQQAPKEVKKEYCQPSLLEKVEQYILDINGNLVDSYSQWQYLKRVYNVISKKPKLSQVEKDILEILEPEIVKHSEYDSQDALMMDSAYMHRYMKDKD